MPERHHDASSAGLAFAAFVPVERAALRRRRAQARRRRDHPRPRRQRRRSPRRSGRARSVPRAAENVSRGGADVRGAHQPAVAAGGARPRGGDRPARAALARDQGRQRRARPAGRRNGRASSKPSAACRSARTQVHGDDRDRGRPCSASPEIAKRRPAHRRAEARRRGFRALGRHAADAEGLFMPKQMAAYSRPAPPASCRWASSARSPTSRISTAFRETCAARAGSAFIGASVIHPSQIAILNEEFRAERRGGRRHARRVVAAYDKAVAARARRRSRSTAR